MVRQQAVPLQPMEVNGGAEIPLQPMMRWQAVPLQPMEVNGRAEIPLQPVEDPTPEQVAGAGEGHDSMGKPTLEQFVEDCSAWKGLVLEKLVEG